MGSACRRLLDLAEGIDDMKAETTLSNIIAALTAIAGALASIAGFVPEQWSDVVLTIATGAGLLAGNLREWKQTFFGAALVSAAAVGSAIGVSACGPRVQALPRIDFVGERAAIESTFSAPASVECAEGSGCAGEIEGVGSVKVAASGVLVVGEQSWPMTGQADAFARASDDGAEIGARVCIDSEMFADINKMLGLIDALNPGATVPRLPSPLCADAH